jgi:hypothetical protein
LVESDWLELEGDGPTTVFIRTEKSWNPAKPGQTRPERAAIMRSPATIAAAHFLSVNQRFETSRVASRQVRRTMNPAKLTTFSIPNPLPSSLITPAAIFLRAPSRAGGVAAWKRHDNALRSRTPEERFVEPNGGSLSDMDRAYQMAAPLKEARPLLHIVFFWLLRID